MSMRRTLFLSALAGLLASATAQAPQVTVSRLDGTGLTGHAVRLADGMLELRTGEGSVTVPLADILALHGAAPRPTAPVTARLVGGDEVRGELRGGDAGGETVTIDSRSLGSVSIAVDRLQAL